MHTDTDWTEGRRIGALAIIRNEAGALLLVEKGYGERLFGLPGGCALPDETPYQALLREVKEETGLAVVADRFLLVDYVPRNEKTGHVEGFNFLWDCGTAPKNTAITLPEAAEGEEPELISYQWVYPADLESMVSPQNASRIRLALAIGDNPGLHDAYLEHGKPVPGEA